MAKRQDSRKTRHKPPTRPVGRPSTYSDKIADAICVRLAMGESLLKICCDSDMPAQSTVYLWLLKNPDFSEKYARARAWQADTLADETIDIADDGRNDWMERAGREGQAPGWELNGEHVQRSRLRIDQRKWYAGKLSPKKYGDKIDVTANVRLTHEQALSALE